MWNGPFYMPSALLLFVRFSAAIPLSLRSVNIFATRPSAPVYRLQICNAYPLMPNRTTALPGVFDRDGVVIRHVQHHEVLSDALKYKACEEFSVHLREGDQLKFSANSVAIGTFTFLNLPVDPTTLLLVVHKHDDGPQSPAEFKSHAFTEIEGAAQLAVIDTSGPADIAHAAQPRVFIQGKPTPIDQGDVEYNTGTEVEALELSMSTNLVQELPRNSVVQVKPGEYLVGTGTSKEPFSAKPMGSYVLMRVVRPGKAHGGTEFVLFPQEKKVVEKSGSPRRVAVLGIPSVVALALHVAGLMH